MSLTGKEELNVLRVLGPVARTVSLSPNVRKGGSKTAVKIFGPIYFSLRRRLVCFSFRLSVAAADQLDANHSSGESGRPLSSSLVWCYFRYFRSSGDLAKEVKCGGGSSYHNELALLLPHAAAQGI